MIKHLLDGGRFALGCLVGVLSALTVLIGLDFFALIPIAGEVYTGAILGALIAGSIGVAGQLLVIVEADRQQRRSIKVSERSSLLSIFAKVLRSFNTVSQLKAHMESEDPFDYIAFTGQAPLMRPIMFSDTAIHFGEDELVAPLMFGDAKLFMLMNEYHDMIKNYEGLHRQYSARMDAFTHTPQDENTLFSDGDKLGGIGQIPIKEYYLMKDLQEHIIATVYPAIIHATDILDSVSARLSEHHKQHLAYGGPLSAEEIEELRASLAPHRHSVGKPLGANH